MTGRLDRDVDVSEENELRRLDGQAAWCDREAHTGARAQHATHSPEGVSARGASSPADSAEGDGEEVEEGPFWACAHTQERSTQRALLACSRQRVQTRR